MYVYLCRHNVFCNLSEEDEKEKERTERHKTLNFAPEEVADEQITNFVLNKVESEFRPIVVDDGISGKQSHRFGLLGECPLPSCIFTYVNIAGWRQFVFVEEVYSCVTKPSNPFS